MVKQASFFYFSGTGNSRRVAWWMTLLARRLWIRARLSSMGREVAGGFGRWGDGGLIGLVFPTHGFTAPWSVYCFALGLPRGRAAAVVIPTRAGSKIGRVFLPGLEGTAGYLVALLLALKGYRVRGVMAVDMPSNWTQLHPGYRPAAVKAIIGRAKKKVARFAARLLTGRRSFHGFVPLALGLLLLPVSLGYFIMGRFWLAKLNFASHRCNGCGQCAASCPSGGITMIGARPYWNFNCEACMRCMNFCPRRAVESSYLMAALWFVLESVPAVAIAMLWMAKGGLVIAAGARKEVEFIVHYFFILGGIYLCYWPFFLLARRHWPAKILAVTTPTYYYRRYREPSTKQRDMAG